ncbi:unnamed protein product [Blepharisma stoltei]|uniref:Eukaryotic translation initiation factor 2A n=1 Tax=Blepharisma stoltei TaxID=1481888 RepID=A0AAU9J0H5_9CILI|nr:unnamed protein product [Blepharisma stoltei]
MINQNEIICRTRDSLMILNARTHEILFAAPCFATACSPTGQKIAYADLYGLRVIDTKNFSEIMRARNDGIKLLSFSHCENYLVTWEKQIEENPNLFVWEISTGQVFYSFIQVNYNKELWPSVVFTYDNRNLLYKNNDEIQIYQISERNLLRSFNEIRIANYSLSPKLPNRLAIYSVDIKGSSPSISYWISDENLNFQLDSSSQITKPQIVTFQWNCDASRVLAICQTEIDNTGRVYPGENALYVMTQGKSPRKINLDEGPIHDIKWSPNNDEFISIAGFFPAGINLYKGIGGKFRDLGKNNRNMIRWNPYGNLFLIGGLGNLQGYIDICERENFNIIGRCRVPNIISCEWGPDGKMFFVGILSPRIRNNNGYILYKYTGEILANFEIGELWEIQWKPENIEMEPLTPREGKIEIMGLEEERKTKDTEKNDNFIPGLGPDAKKKKKKKKKNKSNN